jgi:hypothetical protein
MNNLTQILQDDLKSFSENTIDTNTSAQELEIIKNKIESMSKIHHIKILKIMKNNKNVKVNENKSGVFVNLSFLPNSVINEIVEYIKYIDNQNNDIDFLEKQQEDYKNIFFTEKEDKDNTIF